MQIRLYAILRRSAGTSEVEIAVRQGWTVRDVLCELMLRHPPLKEAIWHENGSLAGHIAVILNGRDIRHLGGINTPISDEDTLDVFPPVGGGGGGENRTRVTLRFAGDLHRRVEEKRVEFTYQGSTLRELISAVVREFDLADLIMEGDHPKPYLQVVINGRLWYAVGGWEAQISEGATVALIIFGGALKPIPMPPGTTLDDLSNK